MAAFYWSECWSITSKHWWLSTLGFPHRFASINEFCGKGLAVEHDGNGASNSDRSLALISLATSGTVTWRRDRKLQPCCWMPRVSSRLATTVRGCFRVLRCIMQSHYRRGAAFTRLTLVSIIERFLIMTSRHFLSTCSIQATKLPTFRLRNMKTRLASAQPLTSSVRLGVPKMSSALKR